MGTVTRNARRAAARAELVQRHHLRRLPVTWLGTGGNKDPADDGWQPRMWTHPMYASGAVFAAGQLMHQAIEHGLIDDPTPARVGVAGMAALGAGVRDAFTSVAPLAALGGIAGASGGLLLTAGEKFSDWARAYFAGGPLVAGAYLTSVALSSPYNVTNLAAACLGTAVGMGMYRRMRQEQDDHELAYVNRFAMAAADKDVARPPIPAQYESDPDARKWNRAFADVGLKGCRYLKREDTPAGFAVLVGLPRTGKVGPDKVQSTLADLERALGMLKDCLEYDVAIDPASGRELSDRCWIHVDVADILAQTLHMPDADEDHTPLSINNAFQIGTFMDGSPIMLRLREISALIVGVRGRGKTNLFHVIVHQLSRCIDVVLWGIDLKGGRAVKPWLWPWLSHKVGRPVFDWVATTRAEANLMLHAAAALIAYRGRRSKGGSKITPSETEPAVIVIADEIAALVGKNAHAPTTSKDWRNPTANQMAKVLTTCIQLGRSEAVDFILCTQRATVTMVGGGDLKSQCEMRIGLGVTNPGDARSVFQNDNVNARKLAKLKHKRTRGAGLIENGDDPQHLAGKFYFYGDDQPMLNRIYRAAELHADNPADLPLLEQQAVDQALRYLTAERDKHGNIVVDKDTGEEILGVIGYGVGPQEAAAQRWSEDRAAHLYSDALPDAWEDDDPSDGEHLGGLHSGSHDGTPPPARGGSAGAATLTRPTATPRRTPDGPQPEARRGLGGAGNRYYIRRADRPQTDGDEQLGQDPAALAGRGGDPADAEVIERELAAWLAGIPETEEPVYDTASPGQLTRYEEMVEIVRAAKYRGLMAGEIWTEMRRRGVAWANRQDMYPALRKAKADQAFEQPAGDRGRYYYRDYAPRQPRTGPTPPQAA